MKNKKTFINLVISCLFLTFLYACASTQQQESTGQYVDSSAITLKAKTALLQDEKIKSLPITVNTYKRTVQLSGFVDNEAQKRRAGRLVARVPGVQAVENDLKVRR